MKENVFEVLKPAFGNIRKMIDGMDEEQAALMHRAALDTALAAHIRKEITAEQRNELLRILNPDAKIVIVEPLE